LYSIPLDGTFRLVPLEGSHGFGPAPAVFSNFEKDNFLNEELFFIDLKK